MLRKLVIKGFQNHKKKVITFSPGITTIIGKNDAGKSAIVRALKWLTQNKPIGDSFINRDEGTASVKLYFDDHVVLRKKSKGVNFYSLDKGKKLKSFKTEVPDKISSELKIGEVNFQNQKELSFWFSLSAGQRAKELNALVDLEVIDRTLSNLASQIRRTKTVVEVTQERLDSALKQKQQLAWTKEANADLEVIEQTNAAIASNSHQIQLLRVLIANDSQYQSTIQDCTAATVGVRRVLKIADNLIQMSNRIQKLKELLVEIDKSRMLKKFVVPDIQKLEAVYSRKQQLERIILKFQKEEKEFNQCQRTSDQLSQELRKVKVCPVCQRPLNEKL